MGKRAQRKARREARRRNRYYLWGVLALVAVAIVVGIVLANRPQASSTAAGADGDYITTDSGLQYRIFEEGDGPQPQIGDTVTVKYAGTLEDGTEFDSGEYTFTIGVDPVIDGWTEGIPLLKEGTHAELRIPPDLAYGEFGQGSIPPGATLLFDVELLEVQPGG
jgi:FKBP-type peptidyl-prolyl cis-trans isomerase